MTLLLVGCGRMGGAMARSWIGRHRVLVLDPAAELPEGAERIELTDAAALPAETIVVLAVKPQVFPSVAPSLAPLAARGVLFVSIMAGITSAGIGAALGGTDRIVRAMPNTPAAIGRGITAAVPGNGASVDDCAAVTELLQTTGALVWLQQESDLDLVTAVSGSGPAYFFRFTEALARAGEEAGLPADLAMQLARATFTGAAALAEAQPDSLAELRRQVTSPAGTTAAGLVQMDSGDAVDTLVRHVVAAAAARSRELAG